ncbi:NAD(P)H-binding protein [Microbacterium sp. cx-55]|uniref:NAD(P)-dependent oxidoreductase n=1 Tax=unclassified Microbacterium TaxID=2609290 RepID=UPI001CBD86D5|nr:MULTISPECIES: NAD(P)H-binding protein [unclassified Microbacterium]MBZ4488452.1 NAD(P)H-binding protein [Microbacterium sp. cx-55]MCC4909486.1 NAD(P)H-binding protein [Microbacterium sp. cx-59]UGB35099.1 NAD(P)H-binding protein [Microbacterium sp. cx-55]
MTRITVIGGTGYAGSNVVREAASRGHHVTSYSRNLPAVDARIDGVQYETGSMLDADVRSRAVAGADVIVSTLSPRGELDGRLVEVDRELAALAGEQGKRIAIVGGFSSLRPADGAPRFADGDDLPPQFAGEAKQMNTILTELLAASPSVDWVFFSPAQQFGSYAPGETLGRYRLGGDVAFFDENGVSAISGADFALAIVDEIERPAHRREHASVAY